MKLKLYWCETDDHEEDWFVVAKTEAQARKFFADHYEANGMAGILHGIGGGAPEGEIRSRDVKTVLMRVVPDKYQKHCFWCGQARRLGDVTSDGRCGNPVPVPKKSQRRGCSLCPKDAPRAECALCRGKWVYVVKTRDCRGKAISWPSRELLQACGGKILKQPGPDAVAFDGRVYRMGGFELRLQRKHDDRCEAEGIGRPMRTVRPDTN